MSALNVPWRTDAQGVNRNWPSVVDAKDNLTARTYGPHATEAMARIVACVNALSGLTEGDLAFVLAAETDAARFAALSLVAERAMKEARP